MESQVKIALCGRIRSGKDTVAEMLAEYGFKRFAFGDGIRDVCRILYPDEMAAGKPRARLQGVGQALRQYDPDVWTNLCLKKIYHSKEPRVVITDLRQPNEFETLLNEGFVIVRVNAPEEVRINRILQKGDVFRLEDFYHETEQYIDEFNVHLEIDNTGTLNDLKNEVASVVRRAEYLISNKFVGGSFLYG